MMQVYSGAIQDSKTGPKQYIFERSLDIIRTNNSNTAIDKLVDGWSLKGVCINGVLYSAWYISAAEKAHSPIIASIYQRICDIVGFAPPASRDRAMRITTQEYFDSTDRDTVYMNVELWGANDSKPEIFNVTPKDRIANKKEFESGQEMAMRILDLLALYGIKQDGESLLRELRASTKNKN